MKKERRTAEKLLSALGVLLAGLAAVLGPAGCRRTAEEEAATKTASVKTLYQCPMHPEIVRDRSGDCPICHMKLQPVEALEEAGAEKPPPTDIAGRMPFKLPAHRQQLIGVTFDTAELKDLTRVIRASGRVAYDPELYSAIEEYQQSRQALQAFPPGSSEEAKSLARSVLKSTRMKLRLLGLSEVQIEELASRSAESAVGLVLGKPGGSVWVYAEVYEYEMNLVLPGQAMVITSPALPGEVFHGKVLAVDPVVSAITRTARVRAEVANPEGKFKPEMYLDVKIRVPLGAKLVIPRDAVLDTGETQLVFVKGPDDSFEPREVRLGAEAEGYVAVQEGVAEGETVVTSANFLIDSEARFRAATEAFRRRSRGHAH